MPIYEYDCGACGRTAGFLVRSVEAHRPPACPRCGARRMRRALSRFAAPRPGPPAEGLPGGLDADDPRAMGQMMRSLAAQSGEAVEPEMDEMIGRLERGEDPEEIENGLGGSSSGGGEPLYDG